MVNMKYCQFENTAYAMQECLDSLVTGDTHYNDMSDYEKRGVNQILDIIDELKELLEEQVMDYEDNEGETT